MAETQFRRSMQLSQGNTDIFISTPFTWVVYALMILALAWPLIWKFIKPLVVTK
jgi:putative tricarboxylic transport membrane protein